jgi:hypothetical protein
MLRECAGRDGGRESRWDVMWRESREGSGHGRGDVGDPKAEDGYLRIILSGHDGRRS